MARIGKNPAKMMAEFSTNGIENSFLSAVWIPDEVGYWEESFCVLKICLESFQKTRPRNSELVIIDNGSCDEVIRFLEDELDNGRFENLILCANNVGKSGAWNIGRGILSGQFIGYFDSDVLFMPGWFEQSKRVLEAFPACGMVTAQPIPGTLEKHCDATLAGASDDLDCVVRQGMPIIEPRYSRSRALSLGLSSEAYEGLVGRRDVLLERGGVAAFVSASHFQFVAKRAAFFAALPIERRARLGDVDKFDEALDSKGYWRLSSTDYLVHHMGNRIPDLREELPWIDVSALIGNEFPISKKSRWIIRKKKKSILRRISRWIYHKLFSNMYE